MDVFINIFLLLVGLLGLLMVLGLLAVGWQQFSLVWQYRRVSVTQALWNVPLGKKLRIKGYLAEVNPTVESPITQTACVFWHLSLSRPLRKKTKTFPAFLSSAEYPKELFISDGSDRLRINLRNAEIDILEPPHFTDQQNAVMTFKHSRTLMYLTDIAEPPDARENLSVKEHTFQPHQRVVVWGQIIEVDRQRVLSVKKMSTSETLPIQYMLAAIVGIFLMGPILVEIVGYALERLFDP